MTIRVIRVPFILNQARLPIKEGLTMITLISQIL